jgi:PKD domain
MRALALAALACCCGLLAAASQAQAIAGVVPDVPSGARGERGASGASAAVAAPPLGGPLASVASVPYLGGMVLHANRTHVIFWDPRGSGLEFEPGYIALVEQFLRAVAADSHMTTNEYAITGQYPDSSGPAAYSSTYGGAVLDNDALPANGCTEPALTGPGWTVCLTDAQLQVEIEHEVALSRWPRGGDNIYFLLTPSGLGSCSDATSHSCALGGSSNGYCGYHSWTPSGTLYAVIPYNAVPGHCQSGNPRPNSSTADPALSTISHEQIETVTDPFGDAWIKPSGAEIADVCLTDYGRALGGRGSGQWDESIDGHHYWLQEIFGRIGDRCEPRPRPDSVTVRREWDGREAVFQARARMPGGSITAYSWSFGDGRHARGPSATHAYARAGSYRLTLRVTDSAGNWAYARRAVQVTRARARDRARRRR